MRAFTRRGRAFYFSRRRASAPPAPRSCAVADEAALAAVLEAAAYLQIAPLGEAAAAAMEARLSPTTALVTWEVAERQNLAGLAAAATAAAGRHFRAIAASPAWLSAPAARVHTLLSSERLAVRCEEEVYAAAVAWLRARAVSEADAAALLGLVRFPVLARDFVRETVHKESLLDTLSGAKMLRDAFAAGLYGEDTVLTRRRISDSLRVEGTDHPGAR